MKRIRIIFLRTTLLTHLVLDAKIFEHFCECFSKVGTRVGFCDLDNVKEH